MPNDVGYLRMEELPALKAWMDKQGVGWNPPYGLWEAIRIFYGGLQCIVTRNKQDQLKTPVELRPLLLKFREAAAEPPETSEITDTERLDFMLEKNCKLVYEVIGYDGRGSSFIDIYVEQGFMSDRRFEAIRIKVENLSVDHTPEQKRAAIDLAITETRSESSD